MGVLVCFYIFSKPSINWPAMVVVTLTQALTATDMETNARLINNHQFRTTVSILHTRRDITPWVPIVATVAMMRVATGMTLVIHIMPFAIAVVF